MDRPRAVASRSRSEFRQSSAQFHLREKGCFELFVDDDTVARVLETTQIFRCESLCAVVIVRSVQYGHPTWEDFAPNCHETGDLYDACEVYVTQ